MTAAVSSLRPPLRLDFKLVLRGTAVLACFCLLLAPLSPNPIAFAVGAAIPWICLRIIYTPTMPAALIYLFVWEWLEIFARLIQAWVDGETLAGGLSGPNVPRAFWYMMASLVVLAAVFRLALAKIRPPTPAQRTAHFRWTVREVALLYGFGFMVSTVAAVLGRGGLSQPAEALGHVKVVALFTLFVYTMSTGRGGKLMLGVVLFEVGIGFTGFLSDFRSVFVFLAISAITAFGLPLNFSPISLPAATPMP